MLIIRTRFIFFLFFLFAIGIESCGTNNDRSSNSYTAIHNRDTALLRLTLYDKSFFGSLIIRKPGHVIDSGKVQGKIIADTLLGDFYYLPFGSRHKKRRAIALLVRGDSLLRGRGVEKVYLGIPYHEPGTVSFDSVDYTFLPDKMETQ
ncbi:hypothetical protein [Sphingobacterium sp. LRF_L2]|uniref:hypothetical protein n=1 Tax=Sphingobacterium sp. LRF_L2 TaxID=3369421 RepID=UPI003F5FF90B